MLDQVGEKLSFDANRCKWENSFKFIIRSKCEWFGNKGAFNNFDCAKTTRFKAKKIKFWNLLNDKIK